MGFLSKTEKTLSNPLDVQNFEKIRTKIGGKINSTSDTYLQGVYNRLYGAIAADTSNWAHGVTEKVFSPASSGATRESIRFGRHDDIQNLIKDLSDNAIPKEEDFIKKIGPINSLTSKISESPAKEPFEIYYTHPEIDPPHVEHFIMGHSSIKSKEIIQGLARGETLQRIEIPTGTQVLRLEGNKNLANTDKYVLQRNTKLVSTSKEQFTPKSIQQAPLAEGEVRQPLPEGPIQVNSSRVLSQDPNTSMYEKYINEFRRDSIIPANPTYFKRVEDSEILKLHNDASDFYRDKLLPYQAKPNKELLETLTPGNSFDRLFTKENMKPDMAKLTFDRLDPKGKATVQAGFVESLATKSMRDGHIDPTLWLKNMKKYEGIKEGIFTKDDKIVLDGLTKVLSHKDPYNPSKTLVQTVLGTGLVGGLAIAHLGDRAIEAGVAGGLTVGAMQVLIRTQPGRKFLTSVAASKDPTHVNFLIDKYLPLLTSKGIKTPEKKREAE